MISTKYLDRMEQIDRIALDLDLDKALPAGKTGWLRVALSPKRWPHPQDRVDLPGFEFLGESHRFKSQVLIFSPVHLRRSLQDQIQLAAEEWEDLLINQGWRHPDTLVRVEEHRISLVIPENMEVSHVVCVPEGALLAIGPTRSRLVNDQYLLHFATGANFNKRRDLVRMAQRVCDYCEFLQTQEEPPTKEHLVTRCGGSEHESVGTLITEMLKARVLSQDGSRVQCAIGSDREARFLDLRRRYTFPTEHIPFLSDLHELHPFSVSFSVRWTSFTKAQQARMGLLSRALSAMESVDDRRIVLLEQLLNVLDTAIQPTRPGCRALIFGCYEYATELEPTYPHILDIVDNLKRGFDQNRCFDRTDLILNPTDGDEILHRVKMVLDELIDGSTCVMWYLGHAKPGDDPDQLELSPTGKGSMGLEWRRLASLLDRYKSIEKIVVLDCCHAGLAKNVTVPERTYIWPTTGPNHTAEAGIVGEIDPGGKLPNFTYCAARRLREHPVGERLSYRELLADAQEEAIHNKPFAPLTNGFPSEPLIINQGLQRSMTFEDVIAKVRNALATASVPS
jgi:hypothetical protein